MKALRHLPHNEQLEIRARAKEILRQHNGPDILTTLEAVRRARVEALVASGAMTAAEGRDFLDEAHQIEAGRQQDRNPKAWT